MICVDLIRKHTFLPRSPKDYFVFFTKETFKDYDKDKSGDVDAYELREILAKLGEYFFFIVNSNWPELFFFFSV